MGTGTVAGGAAAARAGELGAIGPGVRRSVAPPYPVLGRSNAHVHGDSRHISAGRVFTSRAAGRRLRAFLDENRPSSGRLSAPRPGSAVVALSDLGALDQRGSGLVDLWAERGRHLRDLGCHAAGGRPVSPRGLPERTEPILDHPALGNRASTPTPPRSVRSKPRLSSGKSSRSSRSR